MTIRQIVTGMKKRGRARAARILPFRFGGQAIRLTFLLREPLAECDRPFPRHPARRIVIRRLRLRVVLLELRIELAKLRHRDLGDAHRERSRDRDLMSGLLIEVDPVLHVVEFLEPLLPEVVFQRRTVLAHRERACFDAHKPHADGVGDGLGGVQ